MKLSLVRGNYERFERMAVRKFVDLGHPVIELGGCIGVGGLHYESTFDKPHCTHRG